MSLLKRCPYYHCIILYAVQLSVKPQCVRHISHYNFLKQIIDEGDTVTIFVPTTHIPLNSSDCMCESLSQLSDNIDAPVETDCGTKDDECVGLECHLSVEDQQYLLETEVYPCATPPGK